MVVESAVPLAPGFSSIGCLLALSLCAWLAGDVVWKQGEIAPIGGGSLHCLHHQSR